MPPDSEWDDDLLETFGSLRQFLEAEPQDSLLELLLRCPGERDGFGHYEMLPRVLRRHSADRVVEALRAALGSEHASVRYWGAQFAADGYATELMSRLEPLLADPDEDVRVAAITATESTRSAQALRLLRERREAEPSRRIQKFVDESIEYLEKLQD
jgi:hypothetical protein